MVALSYSADVLGEGCACGLSSAATPADALRASQDRQHEAVLCCVVLPPAYAQVEQKQAQVRLVAQAEF